MRLALKLLCSAAFFAVAVSQVNARQFVDVWRQCANPTAWLVLGLLIGLLTAFVNAFKWWLLLRAADVRLGGRRVLYHYLVGYFLNTILTGSGEVKRVVDAGRETGQTSEVLTSVFVERWTGVTARLTLALAALLVVRQQPFGDTGGLRLLTALNLAACVILLVLYVGLAATARRQDATQTTPPTWWGQALRAFATIRDRPGVMGAAAAVSALVPLLGVAFTFCLGQALGLGTAFLLVVPIASVFGQVPISINGLGVQEAAFVWLFGLAGLSAAQALAVSLLTHVLTLAVGGFGGLLSLWAGGAGLPACATQPRKT